MTSLSDACLVCGGRGDGAHFGAVEACRACAAFFRRTVSMDKAYSCRVDGKCPIDASVRCMCRSCRYDKCIEIGMQRQNVQKRRDNHGPRPCCTHGCDLPPIGSPKMEPDSTGGGAPGRPAMFISEEQGMPMLRRVHTFHAQLRAVRRIVHHGGERHVPSKAILHDVDALNLREINIVADFVIGAFPEMAQLEPAQKKTIYQLFFPCFIILECGYRTSLTATPDRVVIANGDYIDTEALAGFYHAREVTRPVDTKQAVELYAPSFHFFKEHVTLPMARAAIDDYEFYALTTLMLWDYDQDKIGRETRAVAEGVRDELIKEILFYYRYVRRYPEDAVRLATLLLLLPPLQRMAKRFVEDIEVGRVFNIYNVDHLTYEIINLRCNTL